MRGLGGASVAAVSFSALHGAASAQAHAPTFTIEPGAGSWRTWILARGDQVRPEPPPGAEETAAELEAVKSRMSGLTSEDRDRITFWDSGSPGFRWNEIAMQYTLNNKTSPGKSYRLMALLNAAIHDATVAVWDAKYAFNRQRPASIDPSLQTVITTPASPSYPSEYAATAGAAVTILGYMFPEDIDFFGSLQMAAAGSRIDAGVEFPSDAAAGTAIGRTIGRMFVEMAAADGSDATYDPASAPTGDGLWTGEPGDPMLGSWNPWVLARGSDLRPGPPPAWDSPERQAEIDEVRTYQREAYPGLPMLFFWPQNPSGRPDPDSAPFSSNQAVYYYAPMLHYVWGPELAQKITEYRLDTNPPRAARAYALVSIAGYDATIACWDAKFHYMTARPNQFDPSITTVFPTPPIPDYPSGHAATMGGTSEVLAYLFPRDAGVFRSRAVENAASRLWAGIHFRSACDVGLKLGRDVAALVIDLARVDGADGQT
jgi:membrane-associated phospholipid phosphatase